MKQKRRSAGLLVTILCILTLLLVACRGGTPLNRQGTTQHITRLNLHETPNGMDTTTPGTTTPGTTANTPAVYVGQVPAENAWIGLASTGKRIIAFVTDGAQNHQPTFAQWFRGAVTNGVVDATAPAKSGADRLQATLTGDTASGTATLANGKSLAFTATAVPATDQTAGLYRSEQTINNQRYIAGWVVLPATSGQGSPTPTATGTTTPTVTGATTPSALESPTPTVIGATATPSAATTPSALESPTAVATDTITPTVTSSVTPTGTASSTPATTSGLQEGGAILNQQNYTVLPVPPLTKEQITAKEINIPGVGTFKLVQCQQNLC